MTITEKYGTTNTVANICEAHGVPLWVGFVLADAFTHGRRGYWHGQACIWVVDSTISSHALREFYIDLVALAQWMHRQRSFA